MDRMTTKVDRHDNQSGSAGFSPTTGNLLDGLALEGGLLGVGEGVLHFDGGGGGSGEGLGSVGVLGGLLAQGLQLLGLAAESADLDCAGLGDEVCHIKVLSKAQMFFC